MMRVARAFLAAGALVVAVPMAGYAASVALPATISGVSVSSGTVSGNVIVRGGQETVDVDATSVKGTLAGHDVPVRVTPAARETRTTFLVIDTSSSMSVADLATVKTAVQGFLAAAPTDVSIGVVSFSDTPTLDLPPTKDRNAVQRVVDALHPLANTALFAAVELVVHQLGNSGDRSFVLLSDGGETVVPLPRQATELTSVVADVRAHNVRGEVIRFKTDESNDGVLSSLASAGGGSVSQATDAQAVSSAFTAAAKALDSQAAWSIQPTVALVGRQPLVLTGMASGHPFTAETTIDFGTGFTPAPTASSSVESSSPY